MKLEFNWRDEYTKDKTILYIHPIASSIASVWRYYGNYYFRINVRAFIEKGFYDSNLRYKTKAEAQAAAEAYIMQKFLDTTFQGQEDLVKLWYDPEFQSILYEAKKGEAASLGPLADKLRDINMSEPVIAGFLAALRGKTDES